jgi:hypothetical protein
LVLTVTQLPLVIFIAGSLGTNLIDRLSNGFVEFLILALAAILAALNSLVIFSIDKKKSQALIGTKRRVTAFTIMSVYFALAITSVFKIFTWRESPADTTESATSYQSHSQIFVPLNR